MTVTRRFAAAFAAASSVLALGSFSAVPVAAADTTPPAIVKALMGDADGDGHVDRVRVYYRERVYHTADTDGVYPFTVSGYSVRWVGGASGVTSLVVYLREKTIIDRTAKPAVKYTRTTSKPVRDAARNQAPTQTWTWTFPQRAVYIAKTGNDANSGSQSAPRLTINKGIARAVIIGARDVYVATGTYSESVGVRTNVSIWGRYAAGTWYRSTSTTTIGTAGAAVVASSATGVWLRDLVIRATTPASASSHVYGIRAANSSIGLERVSVFAGAGATGLAGVDRGDAADGAIGSDGVLSAGGSGGNDWVPGGTGGDGGGGRSAGTPGADGLGSPGSAGAAGAAPAGCDAGGDGGPGGDGQRGSNGPNGTPNSFTIALDTWVAGGGNGGIAGDPGTGGGGGGGGGSGGLFIGNVCSYVFQGGGGGGGGGGGAGGAGGGGGRAGGSSFAVYLYHSTLRTRSGVALHAGNGGTGGRGGIQGLGGDGGSVGIGATVAGAGSGGDGGRGGDGGKGGEGAGGQGGWSVGILKAGGSTTTFTVAPAITFGTPGPGGLGGEENTSNAGPSGFAAETATH